MSFTQKAKRTDICGLTLLDTDLIFFPKYIKTHFPCPIFNSTTTTNLKWKKKVSIKKPNSPKEIGNSPTRQNFLHASEARASRYISRQLLGRVQQWQSAKASDQLNSLLLATSWPRTLLSTCDPWLSSWRWT